ARAYAGETHQLDAKGLPINRNTPDAQALVDAFASDVKSGNLPAVSWIVAPTKFCEHPEKNPPGYGESLCSRLLDVLTADPSVWSQTVFILCYDEEGGFFDHMPAPSAPSNRDNGYSSVSTVGEISHGEAFGLGIRLPFIVASPWSKGGFVCSELFDHTSVIRFLEKRFNVAEPNISPWRRAVCGDLSSMFDFQNTDAQRPIELFAQPHQDFIALADASCVGKKSPEVLPQLMPKQELDASNYPNTRPARALPYDLTVNGALNSGADKFEITFSNTGAAAASFTVYPSSHNSGPWYYTIGAQQSFTENWPLADFGAEKYALRLLGPNGYLRVFQGFASSALSVVVHAIHKTQQLSITLHNPSDKALSVILKDNFYGAKNQAIELAANSRIQLIWDAGASFGWYDFQFKIEGTEQEKQFLRRYAGHLENGLPSRSDPANGMVLM
ncbi:MAG: alkaline phosphatase family protein, partial [Undibacterium sp.]|nr:alkaline phosphatase family protein [Undibacterium sp.]